MLKRKRDVLDPTSEQSSSSRKTPRRQNFLIQGAPVLVFWEPSDIWMLATIDKRVNNGIVVKWLCDGTSTLILDAFIGTMIRERAPAPGSLPASKATVTTAAATIKATTKATTTTTTTTKFSSRIQNKIPLNQTAQSSADITVGAVIYARWEEEGAFYQGRIEAVHSAGTTFDVLFDDGDYRSGVPLNEIARGQGLNYFVSGVVLKACDMVIVKHDLPTERIQKCKACHAGAHSAHTCGNRGRGRYVGTII